MNASYPVTQSVSTYMQRKAEAAYLDALNEVKEFFNQNITFNIVEDIPDGERSRNMKAMPLRFVFFLAP